MVTPTILTEDNWIAELSKLKSSDSGRKVLEFSQNRLPKNPHLLPPFKDLFDYWHALKGEKRLPLKSDFSPAGIRHLAADLILTERTIDDRWIRRLQAAGRVEASGGVNLEGHDVIAELPLAQGQMFLSAIDASHKYPCAHYAVFMIEFENGWILPTESLSLPLHEPHSKSLFTIALMHVRDKNAVKYASMSPLCDWSVAAMCLADIGFGAPEFTAIPATTE